MNNQHKLIYIYSMHPLARQRIKEVIDNYAGEYRSTTLQGAVFEAPRNLDGEILLLDSCSVYQWSACASQWQLSGGRTILVVPTSSWTETDNLRILYQGISGVVSITESLATELLSAIRSVSEGRLWVSPLAIYQYVKRTGVSHYRSSLQEKHLTTRQQQVATFVARGMSNREIGELLCISERTVKFHVSNLLQKCGAGSRRRLIADLNQLNP